MLAPAEAAEHRGRIGAVHGLAEDVAVDLDHGVGAQHPRRPPPRGAGGRLGGGEPPDELRRGLARPRALVDVGRDNHEVDAEPAEQLAAAGRRGGEHELHAPDGRGRVARCQVVGPRGAWYHGRVGRGVWGALLVLAACLARPAPLAPGAREGVRGPRGEPLASGLAALVAGDGAEAAHLFADAARRYPPLADYALYFEARAAMSVGRGDDARDLLARLLADHPDSVWKSRAALLAGALARTAGDLDGARAWLGTARAGLPAGSDRWAWATVALAEIADRRGDHEPALDLARAVRRGRPHGLADRRARRLTERIREAHPDVFGGAEAEAGEAEMRLGEGDLAGARAVAAAVLDSAPTAPIRARALWVRAQAEHALGRAAEAEATCLAVTEAASEPLAPRALAAAARWRWNADEDEQALRLFHDAVRRFPGSAAAAEALYAIGRIHQEAERYGAAHAAYVELAARYPRAPLAAEARWRAGWVRYLAGDFVGAASWFERLAARSARGPRVAAEYWHARTLERLGREAEARARLVHVADRHPTSYYAAVAEARLGRPASAPAVPPAGQAPFPADVGGAHGERARLLFGLALARFARLELEAEQALAAGPGDRHRLLQAYRAVGAPGAALRLALEMRPHSPGALRGYLYPLGYWTEVRAQAAARRLDPFLVLALVRQESLFDPEAVSPADAHGLMQLMPATARELARAADGPAPDRARLHEPAVNIALGTALLRRLLDRYGGSVVKALAAYNAGEDAVAKWEHRYGNRTEDEFVELVSFRETRDYVKAVLRNYRMYGRIYATTGRADARPYSSAGRAPSASATRAGRPPNAPFDMIAMTSPGRADSTR
ncbi:MAG: tetratricopeptide repeat protein [Deltaproteobacteria bacterium]|nr:MAG: tetratricopeptide repeat protein [Deltaproteobacteria bacterium]TMB46149.1 MAG: tetratricopeptide repeat protein [Deltaproteobacteria bacterium]